LGLYYEFPGDGAVSPASKHIVFEKEEEESDVKNKESGD